MNRTRKTKLALLITTTLVASAALLTLNAGAISPQDECEAAGGTFSKEGGVQTCSIAPGNNQGGVTKDESQKGSSRSSHPEEDCVTNNGGTHC